MAGRGTGLQKPMVDSNLRKERLSVTLDKLDPMNTGAKADPTDIAANLAETLLSTAVDVPASPP